MKAFLKFLAGLAAVVAIGIFSIERNGLPGSLAAAELRLDAHARTALDATGSDWAEVEMDGQKAVLYGDAPNAEAVAAAAHAVAGAEWRGGPVLGGVTYVDASRARIREAFQLVDPFLWVAELNGGEIAFSGFVPSESARTAILNLAALRFPGAVVSNEVEIARGAPPEETWLSAVSVSLQALAALSSGAVEASGATFVVTGRAENEAQAETARALMASMPAGVEGRAVLVAPAPYSVALSVDPEDPDAPDLTIDVMRDDTGAADRDDAGTQEPFETAAAAALDAEALEPETPVAAADDAAAAADELIASEPADEAAEPAEEAEPVDPAHLADCSNRFAAALRGLRLPFASETVLFDPGREDRLREVATLLFVCPEINLRIVGHTDSSGAESLNQNLSRERAAAVAARLASYGVEPARLTIIGAGAGEPVGDNATSDGRARNRRVEFGFSPAAEP